MNRTTGEVKNGVRGMKPWTCPFPGALIILMLVSGAVMAQPSGLLFQRDARVPIGDAAGGGYPNGSAKATALGLLDSDSAVDMVVGYMVNNWSSINGPTYRIAVYYNSGDPTNWGTAQNLDFTAAALPEPPHYTSFNEKYDTIEDIAIADIDGDGLKDILFCTHVDGVLWFRQTANRVFAASPYNNILSRNTAYTYYVNCRRVLAVNLDGDAELEVVVARGETAQAGGYNSSGRVSVYNRSGALPFTWTESTVENYSGSAQFPVSLRAANLAGTSALDLVVCWKASNTVKWYLNNGSGSFSAVTPTGVTYNEPYDTGFADVDKDTDLDLIVVQRAASSPGASVRVLFNDGTTGANNFTGGFTVSSGYVGYRNAGDSYDVINNDKYPIYVEGGDFDQDGDGDFFVSWNNLSTPTRANGDVVYFENTNGAGTGWTEFSLYTSGLNSPADTGPMQMEMITAAPSATNPAGFPDTYPDLAVYNRSSKTLSFWNQTTYTTAPYLTNLVVIGAREVHLTFSEAMNASDLATLAYYEASGAGRGSLAVNPTGVSNVSGNTYRLTWSSGQLQLGGALTITANAAMRDAAGYRIRQPRALTVTVTDGVAPTVACQNLTRALSPTSITVGVGEVCTSVTDNWTPPSPIELLIKRSADPDTSYAASVTFTCADIGPQAVTVRARDVALPTPNAGTCTATITITGTMINQLQAPALRELYVGDALPGVQVIADCGVTPYTFQWQYSATPGFASPLNCNNGQPHPADPSVIVSVVNASPLSTLSFPSATLLTVGYYRCVATDSAGSPSTATSANFQLDVRQAVAATDPAGGHRNTGGSITFSTTASLGYTPYSYAWYKTGNPTPLANGPTGSGSSISGATTNSMTISTLQLTDEGSYYCVVTDKLVSGSGSTKQTAAASLTVTDLLGIGWATSDNVYTYGTTASFTVAETGGRAPFTFTWEYSQVAGIWNPLTAGSWPFATVAFADGNRTLNLTQIGGVAANNVTIQFRCTVDDALPAPPLGDPNVTTTAASLTKRSAVSVSVTPATASLKNYIDPLTLTANASGGFEPLTYQWALSTDGGVNWTDLSDGPQTFSRPGYDPLIPCAYTVSVTVNVSGAQSSVLNIDHPLYTVHGGQYRCTVKDNRYPTNPQPEGTAFAGSNVSVTDHVAIVRQPQGGEYYDGNTLLMSIAVIGGVISVDPLNPCSAPLNYSYQWRYGPTAIQDSSVNPFSAPARSQVPSTPPPPPYDYPDYTGYSGNYNVQVTDSSTVTARTSQSTSVTVRDAVNFTVPPEDTTANVLDSVSFPVEAAGGYPGYSYVWTWNSIVLTNGPHPSGSGSTVSGATSDELVITTLGEDDEGTYEVTATDTKAPCPSHFDKCTATASAVLTVSNHIVITDAPDSLNVYDGDNVSFSVTAGGGDPPTYEYAWYWDFGAGGVQLLNGAHPSGSGAVISGASTSTLTINGVGLASQPQFSDAGNYYVTVGDAPPENNPATSDPAALAIFAPVRFTASPVPLTRYVGESAAFTVAASGGLLNQRSFQWQVDTGGGFGDLSNGSGVSGVTTTTLTISPVALADNGKQYRCIVTSPDSDVTTLPSNTTHISGTALLRVSTALSILDRPADVQAYVTDPAFDLRVHFQGGLPPYSSDWRRAGLDPVSPEVSAGAGSILLGAPNTTVLTVIPGSLTPGLHSYAAQLTDQVRMTRSLTGTVEVANNLNFVKGLSNVFVRQKERFTWSVEVEGGLGTVNFQWFKNDQTKAWVPVPEDAFHQDTTTDSLLFVEVDFDDAGQYRIEVSDDFTMISSQAQMSVGVALPVAGVAGLALLSAVSALAGAAGLRRRRK